jgi:hypothetical protein
VTKFATVVTAFAELLVNRLNIQVHTTEDGVRYTCSAREISMGPPSLEILRTPPVVADWLAEHGRFETAVSREVHACPKSAQY